jgi:hypothetical protein
MVFPKKRKELCFFQTGLPQVYTTNPGASNRTLKDFQPAQGNPKIRNMGASGPYGAGRISHFVAVL